MSTPLSYVERYLRWIFRRIRRSTYLDPSAQSGYRVLFGLFTLIIYLPSFGWVGEVPDALFDPPPLSLLGVLKTYPTTALARTLDLLLVVAAVGLTLGVRARISALLLAFLFIVSSNLQFSFGKIDHHSLYPLALCCFAFSNWGCSRALYPDRRWKRD